MKLSPPASCSDLESAREIARRLHQRRRRGDRPADGAFPARPAEAARGVSSPAPMVPSPAPPHDTPRGLPWEEPPAPAGPGAYAELDPLAGFGEPAAAEYGSAGTADVGVAAPGVSPEEMVGGEEPAFDDLPDTEAEDASPPSPFDEELDDAGGLAEEAAEAQAPPSWDDLVQSCLAHAHAQGAMLVDPAGQVLAAHGDWPDPGPDAIAAKLVATMDRTLRDAPTRSISAPLKGKHLTAWRVLLAEGLVTAAFIGDAPVRADARPAIDDEIHRGVGA
jgi:hypothetical protein